ncbi:hypothetical protein [Chryseobacterium sp. MYb328]|uniref:hypothetical protein n=1 Tax=Chryseobacterium sp. MYb328 TaxID=2745231 RepID=UPI0030B0F4B1
MKTEDVLKIYDIEFIVSKLGTPFFLGGGAMEELFTFLRSPMDINDLLEMTDHYLNGNPFPVDNDWTVFTCTIEMTSEGVVFVYPGIKDLDRVVPLKDFKIIATAWLDFLERDSGQIKVPLYK